MLPNTQRTRSTIILSGDRLSAYNRRRGAGALTGLKDPTPDIEANERLGLGADLRQYGQCAEVLLDLGLCRVRVLSNNPAKVSALEHSGLEVVERVALEVPPTCAASAYLRTKKERMGHLLELV